MSSRLKKSLKREIDEVQKNSSSPPSRKKRVDKRGEATEGNSYASQLPISTVFIEKLIENKFANGKMDSFSSYVKWKMINRHWYNVILNVERGYSNIWKKICVRIYPNITILPVDLLLAISDKGDPDALIMIEGDEETGKEPIRVLDESGAWFLQLRRMWKWANQLRIEFDDTEATKLSNDLQYMGSVMYKLNDSQEDDNISNMLRENALPENANEYEKNFVEDLIGLITEGIEIDYFNTDFKMRDENGGEIILENARFYPIETDWITNNLLEFSEHVNVTGVILYIVPRENSMEAWKEFAEVIKENFMYKRDRGITPLVLEQVHEIQLPEADIKLEVYLTFRWESLNPIDVVWLESMTNPRKSSKYAQYLLNVRGGRIQSLQDYIDIKYFKKEIQEYRDAIRAVQESDVEVVDNFFPDPGMTKEERRAKNELVAFQKKQVMIYDAEDELEFHEELFSHMNFFFDKLEDGYGKEFWETFSRRCFPKITYLPTYSTLKYNGLLSKIEKEKEWCQLVKRIFYWSKYAMVTFSSTTSSMDIKKAKNALSCENKTMKYEYLRTYNEEKDEVVEFKNIPDLSENSNIEEFTVDNPLNVEYSISGMAIIDARAFSINKKDPTQNSMAKSNINDGVTKLMGETYFSTLFLIKKDDVEKWKSAAKENPGISFNRSNAPSKYLTLFSMFTELKWGNLTSEMCNTIHRNLYRKSGGKGAIFRSPTHRLSIYRSLEKTYIR